MSGKRIFLVTERSIFVTKRRPRRTSLSNLVGDASTCQHSFWATDDWHLLRVGMQSLLNGSKRGSEIHHIVFLKR